MNRYLELILILSMILSGITVFVLVGLMNAGWFIYDRLDKPNFLKRMRTLCKTYRICLVLLIILRVIQVAGLFLETRHYTQPSAFEIIFRWTFVVFFAWLFFNTTAPHNYELP